MSMQFMNYAAEENLEATKVAVVTEEPRLVLVLERQRDRKYYPVHSLDTNGAHQETTVDSRDPKPQKIRFLQEKK